ncbi:MAG: DUF58 domain-containing protein [Microthrixaceae bacterium]
MTAPLRQGFRITGSGWKVLGSAVGVAAFGVVLGIREAVAISVGMIAVVAYCATRTALWYPMLRVERRIRPLRVSVGDTSSVEITVTNSSRRSSAAVVVNDFVENIGTAVLNVGPIASNDSQSISFTLPTNQRGVTTLGPCSYRLLDPFRLVERSISAAGVEEAVIWPTVWQLDFPVESSHSPGGASSAGGKQVTSLTGEFATLADYVAGDDPRHIHWPSSARAGRLIVRRFEPSHRNALWVLLDTLSASGLPFEVAVSMTASILTAADQSGTAAELGFIGADGITSSPPEDPPPLAASSTEMAAGNRPPVARSAATGRLDRQFDQLAVVTAVDPGTADPEHLDRSRPESKRYSTSDPFLRVVDDAELAHHLGLGPHDRVIIVTARPGKASRPFAAVTRRGGIESTVISIDQTASPSSFGQTEAQALLDQTIAVGLTRSTVSTWGSDRG